MAKLWLLEKAHRGGHGDDARKVGFWDRGELRNVLKGRAVVEWNVG